MTEPPRPLSVGQEALWFLHQLAPDSGRYNVLAAVRIGGLLDVPRLRRAVEATVNRHDLLRSRIAELHGEPCRVLVDAAAVPLEVRDVGPVDEAGLVETVRQAGLEPFDLTGSGTFRAVLFRRTDDDAVLLLAAHHVATDATSQWLALRDTLHAYDMDAAPWAQPAAGYDDVVAEERRLLAGPHAAALRDYWMHVCAGLEPAELPLDHPRPLRPTYAGSTAELVLPEGFDARLRSTAVALGVTPFAVLLGAFEAFVHRTTGRPDLAVGCPMAVRSGRGRRDLVGYLVNTLVLRSGCGAGSTLADAVRSADEQVRQGIRHSAYPHALLVRDLGLPPAANRAPLFQVVFTLVALSPLNALLHQLGSAALTSGHVDHAGLRLRLLDVPMLEGQFDLSVEMRRAGRALTAVFRYSTEVFERATVEDWLDRYARMLETTVTDPDTRIARIRLVDQPDISQLLRLGTGRGAAL